MKLLIVTTDATLLKWKSLDEKKAAILAVLNTTKNATWEIEIIYRDLTPEVIGGRITYDWFDHFSYPLFRQGNHIVGLHMSLDQQKKWKIQRSLRGSNQRDKDFVGEFYFFSDEKSKREGLSQFIQTCLHEISHELAHTTDCPKDLTHEYHGTHPDISGIFPSYDLATWQPVYQKQLTLIEQLKQLIASFTKPQKPKFFMDDYPISQAYGVPNAAWYPKTGHHIGTDIATPENTPILAPWPCEVTRVGYSATMGNWCEVYNGEEYYYFLHLKAKPVLGQRQKGWVIAFTGKTGNVTGPHLHLEGWYNKRNIDAINKDNWQDLTFKVL